jgi:RNA-directed DNA polymerase
MGLSACADKVVPDAVREVREASYAQDCLACSDGCRPRRRAHDAVRTLDQSVHRGEGAWRREADIVSCFASWDRTERKRRLELRGVEGARLRLIGQCVHVGVRDGEA